MISTVDHKERIREELIKAGTTNFGLMKMSSRYLHNVIHENEHVMAVAYGRYEGGSGILVGTDKHVIFLDHKPGFTVCDEIAFDVIVGIKSGFSGPFASITLHTRLGDYQMRYVNHVCARNFVHYIEGRRLENPVYTPPHPSSEIMYQVGLALTPEAKAFLLSRDVAVLSSEDRRGNISGAPIYYLVGENEKIYILTRSGTEKARNILAHTQVALTVFEADPPRSLQIQGSAEIEPDQKIRDEVFAKMIQPRQYKGGMHAPPVTTLKEGGYIVIAITPTNATYHPYQQPKTEV